MGRMLRAIRSYLSYQASVRAEAQMLIDLYGEESPTISRDRAFAAMRDSTDSGRAWHVDAIVERRLRVRRQPDTATRYLEGARRRKQHPFLW